MLGVGTSAYDRRGNACSACHFNGLIFRGHRRGARYDHRRGGTGGEIARLFRVGPPRKQAFQEDRLIKTVLASTVFRLSIIRASKRRVGVFFRAAFGACDLFRHARFGIQECGNFDEGREVLPFLGSFVSASSYRTPYGEKWVNQGANVGRRPGRDRQGEGNRVCPRDRPVHAQ